MRLIGFIISLFLLSFPLSMNLQAKQNKSIYGLYEQVHIKELGNVAIKAKLDTGALTSSFSAKNVAIFNKNGQPWVRFQPQVEGLNLPTIEKPLIRYSKIKTRNDDIRDDEDKSHTQRPVVKLNVCFDGQAHEIEVNLTDRSRFNYPLLIARTALVQFKAIVDPSLRYKAKSDCSL